MRSPVLVGVSFKAYFTNAQARDWLTTVAARVRAQAAVIDGTIELFVIPTYLQIRDAIAAFSGTGVRIGAQDVSQHPPGAFTGEITADELAEIGVTIGEIGHAERRRLLGDTDQVVAAKARAALAHGITPVICVGESEESADAVTIALAQVGTALEGAPAGPVIVAYEPVWAIGALEPARVDRIAGVTTAIRRMLDGMVGRRGSAVVYGGSAGPGLLTELAGDVDGVFLGRFAHNPDDLEAILAEAALLASRDQVSSV